MPEQYERVPRVCLVATVPMPLVVFMGPHIRALGRHYDITIVTNGGAGFSNTDSLSPLLGERVSYQNLQLAREVSVFADLLALIRLWRLFRREKFQVVHSITPKAGLLTMIAGLLAGVPVRIHWFTGQVWATRKGPGRWLLKTLDRLLAACSTHLLADSPSQSKFLSREGIVRLSQVTVLGKGSVCGVDTARFQPDPVRRSKVRVDLGIADTAVVALYLGRLKSDKGISELASAFLLAAQQHADLHLLLVGPDEEGMQALVMQTLSTVSDRVYFVGFTKEPEAFMAAADFFVLPSHREGFGSSVIEAAACGIPAIGSRIYGLTDAIVDGETGLLVPVGDVVGIADAMIKFAMNRDFRLTLGEQALVRVKQDFKQVVLTDALLDFYATCLKQKVGADGIPI
jgi:glycosyltransferase involved in cell wall biosynthesis